MRQDVIDLAQSAIWQGIGDHVDVFAPGADVRVRCAGMVRPGRSELCPRGPMLPPRASLGYQEPIRGFSFRLDGAPELKQGTQIRHAAAVWSVAEIAEAGSDQIRVTVVPI